MPSFSHPQSGTHSVNVYRKSSDVPVVLELTAQQVTEFLFIGLVHFYQSWQPIIVFADEPSFALVRPHSTWSLRYQITLSKQKWDFVFAVEGPILP